MSSFACGPCGTLHPRSSELRSPSGGSVCTPVRRQSWLRAQPIIRKYFQEVFSVRQLTAAAYPERGVMER
jgi:hypothetical protein